MKLDYTIGRIFGDMSLSELEKLHHVCEQERKQLLHSLALGVLRILCRISTLRQPLKYFYLQRKHPLIILLHKKVSSLHVFDNIWDNAVPCGSKFS